MNQPGKYLNKSVILVFFLNILILTACGIIELEIEKPSNPTETNLPPISSGGTQSATIEVATEPTQTDSPSPTIEPTPTLDVAGPPDENPVPLRIEFGDGQTRWTYVNILEPGDINRFVLFALEGQIMSVFIEPSGMGLSIIGDDGSLLAEKKTSHSFWRGELPSTQDYVIELDPMQTGIDHVANQFKLTVVVNPVGQLTQLFEYVDTNAGFMLEYSDYFAVDPSPNLSPPIKGDIIINLAFIGTEFYADTNLSNAFFFVAVSRDPDVVFTCLEPLSQEELGEEIEVNSITFQQTTFQGIGLGNIYEHTIHRSAHDGACYEVIWLIHFSAIGNFPDGSVREFDAAQLLRLMREVLLSFRYISD